MLSAATGLPVLIALLLLIALVHLGFRYYEYNRRAIAYFQSRMSSMDYEQMVSSVRDEATFAAAAVQHLKPSLPAEVDLVVSGGGFKVCVAVGVVLVLQALGVRIVRVAGTSAGAQVAFLILNHCLDDGMRWTASVAATFSRFPFMRPAPMWEIFYRDTMAMRCPVPSPGEFTVSVCEIVSWLPPRGRALRASVFVDKAMVGEALLATATVPWLLAGWFRLSRRFLGRDVVDGGLTDNCPAFTDGIRPQLVISWDNLPARLTEGLFFSHDECLELTRLGIAEGIRCVQQQQTGQPPPKGETACCAAIVRPEDDASSWPPAARRRRNEVDVLAILSSALATYSGAAKHAVR
jgi:hypothetical protein